MEKAVPFPTGYRFGVKQQKHLALQYEITIRFLVEDCKTFSLFLLSICASSGFYSGFEIFYQNYGAFGVVVDVLGAGTSVFGVFVFFYGRQAYKALKAKMVKRNIVLLAIFFIFHVLYLVLKAIQLVLGDLELNSKFPGFLLGFWCFYLFIFSYFLLAQFELAGHIKGLNSLN
jgi:uncharacterized membrane-anchored protein